MATDNDTTTGANGSDAWRLASDLCYRATKLDGLLSVVKAALQIKATGEEVFEPDPVELFGHVEILEQARKAVLGMREDLDGAALVTDAATVITGDRHRSYVKLTEEQRALVWQLVDDMATGDLDGLGAWCSDLQEIAIRQREES